MKIPQYKVELDLDGKNILVKENNIEYMTDTDANSVKKVVKLFNNVFRANVQAEEHVWMLALNTKNVPVGVFEISHGTVNYATITPREVCIRLCLCGAARYILAHNHPSGDCTPSPEDVKITNTMKKAGEIMNIPLIDHIIIGDGYFSFCENSIL